MKQPVVSAAVLIAALAFGAAAEARDTIRVVGSSTVFPFSTTVAEQFGAKSGFATPVVESTGTGAGMNLFCGGVGADHPDVTGASRKIKASEVALCVTNGVTEIVELKVGFDGIVLANAKDAPDFSLEEAQIFKALAAELPASDEDCTLSPNPNQNWSDIDPSLPNMKIEVFGPPTTSGTRDAFVEIAMETGAEAAYGCLAAMKKSDAAAFQAIAHHVREDNAWIDAGENDNAIVNTLIKTPTAIGVFGYSFLDQNRDTVKPLNVEGVEPTFDNVASGDYPVARSLFVYAKKQHVGLVPGVQEYLVEFASDAASGDLGYLGDKGLIPLPADAHLEMQTIAEDFTTIDTTPAPVETEATPAAPVAESAPATEPAAEAAPVPESVPAEEVVAPIEAAPVPAEEPAE